jgi:hypothetical protein
MPIANNQGVRVHYEVESEGPPLVLQHGFSDANPHQIAPPDPFLPALTQGAQAIPALWGAPMAQSLKDRLSANDVQALIAYRTRRFPTPSFWRCHA